MIESDLLTNPLGTVVMKPTRQQPASDYLLTVEDVAKLLKVSKRTIFRWLAKKRLPEPIRYSRVCLRWRASVIEAWMVTGNGG